MDSEEQGYFELKYLEEINELFNEIKEVNHYFNLRLLDHKTFIDFYEFIQRNVNIYDMYNDESISDNENDI